MKEITADLKNLINLKLKLDEAKDQYEKTRKTLLEKMTKSGIMIIKDTGGIVSVKRVIQDRRKFSIAGVKAALGDKAANCITEEVSAKKFDALINENDKCILTEDKLNLCYTITKTESLVWDGLKAHKVIKNKED
jgi:hypothetical protein